MESRISSLEARVTVMESSVSEIRTGLIGGPNSPGVYEQIRSISSTVNRLGPQMDHIESGMARFHDSYKANVWYVRGLCAAIGAGGLVLGYAIKLYGSLHP